MDRTPEVLYFSAPGTSAGATTGVKLRIPLVESLHITEFGVLNDGGADFDLGVVSLQVLDSTNAATTIISATGVAAVNQGTILSRRCDVFVDKVNNVYNAGAGGTSVAPTAGRQWTGIQLNLTGAATASSTGTYFIKVRKAGSGVTAVTGENLVTS